MSKSRTCFSSAVCTTKKFLSMSPEAQALYLRLGFETDNDGFIEDIEGCALQARREPSAVDELVSNGYIHPIGDVHLVADHMRNHTKDNRNYRSGNHVGLLGHFILDDDSHYIPVESGTVGNQSDDSLQSGGGQSQTQHNKKQHASTKEKQNRNQKEQEYNEIAAAKECPFCHVRGKVSRSVDEFENTVIDCHACGTYATVNDNGEIIDRL